jgi:alpha-D-ribose 1-methylphosphonate 5-triphosphate diphosphatase
MWLSAARLVLPDQVLNNGSLRVEDGLIAEIVEGPVAEADLSLPDLIVIPGIVDMHGDMLEREIQPRPQAEFPVGLALLELDKRLAANGVTTAFAAISFNWPASNTLRTEAQARQIIQTINHMRENLLVDHRVHVRFEITNPQAAPLLDELLRDDQVHLVCLNDHTPGQGQYRNIEQYIKTMTEWRQTMVDTGLTEDDLRREVAERQNRPKVWDLAEAIVDVAKRRNVLLASHDDDTPDKVAFVSSLGVRICEFPVTMEAARAAKDRGLFIAMGAPNALRGGSHSNNLSAVDAIRAGLVDMLASDYHPPSLLHAVFKLYHEAVVSLPQAINLITRNPAQAVGMPDRGALAVGRQADLVLVEESPFVRVRGTFRRGVPVYWAGAHFPAVKPAQEYMRQL